MSEAMAEEHFKKTVGHRIAIMRIKKGFSQQELARACRTSRERLSSYECGHAQPRSYTLYKIAETLDVSLDALVSPLH